MSAHELPRRTPMSSSSNTVAIPTVPEAVVESVAIDVVPETENVQPTETTSEIVPEAVDTESESIPVTEDAKNKFPKKSAKRSR